MFSFDLTHQCLSSAIQSHVKLLGFINLLASDTHLLLSIILLSVNPEIEFVTPLIVSFCYIMWYKYENKIYIY